MVWEGCFLCLLVRPRPNRSVQYLIALYNVQSVQAWQVQMCLLDLNYGTRLVCGSPLYIIEVSKLHLYLPYCLEHFYKAKKFVQGRTNLKIFGSDHPLYTPGWE